MASIFDILAGLTKGGGLEPGMLAKLGAMADVAKPKPKGPLAADGPGPMFDAGPGSYDQASAAIPKRRSVFDGPPPVTSMGGEEPRFGGGMNTDGTMSLAGGGGGGGPLAIQGWGDEPIARQGPLNVNSMANEAKGIAGPVNLKRNGVFDRIGDFLSSDEGRAALLRSGAVTMSTGDLGAGIMAGAGYVDERKKREAGIADGERDDARADRGMDINQQNADTATGTAAANAANQNLKGMISLAELRETMRKNRAGEQLTEREQTIRKMIADQSAGVQMRGQDMSASTQERGQDLSFDASVFGTQAGSFTADKNRDAQYAPTLTETGVTGDREVKYEKRMPTGGSQDEVRRGPDGQLYRRNPVTGLPELVR